MTVINGSALLRAAPLSPMLATKERAHGVSHGRRCLTQSPDYARRKQAARCWKHRRSPNRNGS